MKTLITFSFLLVIVSANAQLYGTMDLGGGYRINPIQSKTGHATDDKQLTTLFNATVGYRLQLESESKELSILFELNNRLPLLDNTNALSSGLRTGFIIPVGENFKLVPMAGMYLNYRSIAGPSVNTGYTLRTIGKVVDAQFYVDASYINGMAGLGVGLIINYTDKHF